MKRILKILVGLVALLVLAAAGFATYVQLSWPLRRPTRVLDLKVELTPERLARGKKLVSIRCALCHYDQQTGALTGRQVPGEPAQFGKSYSHNITRHPTRGTGRYTDGELLYLLRTGIRRDGVYPGPYMISPFLSDEDAYSIIAFLRSDDPWVRPLDVADPPSAPSLLAKFLFHFVIPAPAYPAAPIPPPDPNDKVALVKYQVVAVGDCFVCHSLSFPTLDSHNPEKSAGYMGGGNELIDGGGRVVRGANLTMDRETGIGTWSEADFVRSVRTGFLSDYRPLRYPMVPYGELTEAEVSAIFAYLKTVPPLGHAVPRDRDDVAVAAGTALTGEQLYGRYQCASCHGSAGVGICDLRHASKDYDSDEKLARFIRDPSQFVPGTKMPTWDGVIAESEYAPLVAHVHRLEAASVTAAK
jgi:mono/diheme cytochrome c family protein